MKTLKMLVVMLALVALVGCATPGALGNATESGGDPSNVGAAGQGAQIQSGQQGQVGETGSATTYANPTVNLWNILGSFRYKRVEDSDGSITETIEADGVTGALGSVTFPDIAITYSDAEITSEVSSGGGGAAGVADGVVTSGKTEVKDPDTE